MDKIRELKEELNKNSNWYKHGFVRCNNCGFVKTHNFKEFKGYKCLNCNEWTENTVHFGMEVYHLINYIYEFYTANEIIKVHLEEHKENLKESALRDNWIKEPALLMSVLFCSLTELLLHHFLFNLMEKEGYKIEEIIEILYKNIPVKVRLKVFEKVTIEKWVDAVKKVNKHSPFDYVGLNEKFIETMKEEHDYLLHSGFFWPLGKEAPLIFIDYLQTLVTMFKDLHNEYCIKTYTRSSKDFYVIEKVKLPVDVLITFKEIVGEDRVSETIRNFIKKTVRKARKKEEEKDL